MAKLEYVAQVIEALDDMEGLISGVPELVAEAFLRSTLVEIPRPPWESGALRRSGVAYIGGQVYMTTNDLAGVEDLLDVNPAFRTSDRAKAVLFHGFAAGIGESSAEYYDGADRPHSYSAPRSIGRRKFVGHFVSGGRNLKTMRNKVTIMYTAPYAALMHEWSGKFSDAESGKHFITAKVFGLESKVALAIKKVHQ